MGLEELEEDGLVGEMELIDDFLDGQVGVFFASRMTKSSIQSGAERPEACLMSLDRYLGVKHSLSA